MLLIFTLTFAVRAVKSTANELNQVRNHDAAVPLPLEEMKWDPEEDSAPLADTGISSEAELDVITKPFDEEIRKFISNRDIPKLVTENIPDRTLAVRAVKSMLPKADGLNGFRYGAEAGPMTFDEKIRNAFPRDVRGLIIGYSPGSTLNSLSLLNKQWNDDCEEFASEEWLLIEELEYFRKNPAIRTDPNLKSSMDPTEEIEHYLNGFDTRMYTWLMMFHRDSDRHSDGPVSKEIVWFARNLAEHRATLFRPPPHRRGKQKEIPRFDAFIRMRDNIMKILENRIRKDPWQDHIMFDYDDPRANPSSLSLARKALMEMMKIMETIGVVIAYPGLQEMQKFIEDSHGHGHFGVSQSNKEKVQHMLRRTTNIKVLLQWEFDWYGSRKSLMEVLSRDSCIGKEAKDDIVDKVQTFIRNNLEASCWSLCSVQ